MGSKSSLGVTIFFLHMNKNHWGYEDAGTFLGFAFTKSGIRCRAASDAGLHPKNACILICAMQRSSDAGAASRHHPAYINHEYQQKNWKIKKKSWKIWISAKKSWKICKKKVENAFLRFSKCKSCIRCIFCIRCQNAAPLVNALNNTLMMIFHVIIFALSSLSLLLLSQQ